VGARQRRLGGRLARRPELTPCAAGGNRRGAHHRTIEYWDIEKARYPHFDHVAVIVAEDIASRFLNVISLFNKAIALIAIQMRALVCLKTACHGR